MTLNVSLRVPDGIVIASDSLSTLTSAVVQKLNVVGKCQKCGEQVEIKDVQTPPMAIPSSTWPYAQKLFPIQKQFGVAIWGNAAVNFRSMYNHIIELTPRFPKIADNEDGFQKTLDFIRDYFCGQLLEEWKKVNVQVDLQPDNFWPFGFHFVGYARDANNEPVAKTAIISIGKKPKVEVYESIGCTVSGDRTVVTLLWGTPPKGANFSVFSLQDAILRKIPRSHHG